MSSASSSTTTTGPPSGVPSSRPRRPGVAAAPRSSSSLSELNAVMNDLMNMGDESRLRQLLKDVPDDLLRALYERSRELGKSLFIASNYSEAFEKYSGALCLTSDPSEKASLFANRAACYLKQNRFREALNEGYKSIASLTTFAKVT
eukprot:Protomagalhaensia_wolfi_Nauph_80__1145@NODE_1675_length_1404_cov_20_295238_g1299_i0_p1_GENE_NODE_1675_length_1404_cov_20_295238_g1299_i0NODE_1675_length_1404_cov_20_295238_g1299_i0_p1_ORF_typecomplete_len147_score20_37Rapsyn_N/PF10579_9/0_0012TPR_16/PF13432_6/0_0045ANAPC3/PF12895_7/0_0028TPR_MalT/PF17874_1/0_0025TPR_12/PF13424_6/0_0046TPR_1/PF00515_28/1e03TPR_1/PF00515_28/0_012TPR_11/PF13414_6/0_014TPR_19/PF14559_6/1_7e03TPR_19/PF14559_6/0_061DUF3856/PF12968_7/0_033TPR_21/PF09976_9/0_034TPR_2/PF